MGTRKQALKPLWTSVLLCVSDALWYTEIPAVLPYLIVANVSRSYRMGLLLWGPQAIMLRNPQPCKYQRLLPISKRHGSWQSPALCMSLKPLIVSRWAEKSCEVLPEADLWLQRSYSILRNALNIIYNGFPGWFAFLFLCSSLFRRGFCFFNSVAITAKYLRDQLNISKILIVDLVCIPGQSCIFSDSR